MTTQVVTVDAIDFPVATYRNIRVITTELLAQAFGSEAIRIQQNHKRNAERFIEGKHFFKLIGDELQEFATSFKIVANPSKVRSLILWTERGAARHAKLLETDQAWEVFEKLEDAYFLPAERPTAPKATPSKRSAGAFIKTKIALLFHREMVAMGVEPNLSLVNVLQATEEFTGLPAEKMRKVLTVEPANIASLNQTQLGEKAGLSSREVGKRLRDCGLMTTNAHGDRLLTDDGKQYGAMVPFTKNGHSSYEPRWFASVLAVIAPVNLEGA